MGTIYLIFSFISVTFLSFTLCFAKNIGYQFFWPQPDKPKRELWRNLLTVILFIISLVVLGLVLSNFWKTYTFSLKFAMTIYIIALLIANILIHVYEHVPGEDVEDKLEYIIPVYIFFPILILLIILFIAMFSANKFKSNGNDTSTTIFIDCNSANKNNTTVNLATVGKNEMNMYFIASYNENDIKLPTNLKESECEIIFIEENENEKLIITNKLYEEYTWIYRKNIPKENTVTEAQEYTFYVKRSNIKTQ